jgi:glycosyltransferase involved in cell wall biosynthesis
MTGRLKVLALVPGIYDLFPGQRYRIEQWEPILNERGVDITYAPFENEALRSVVYKSGHTGTKIAEVLRGFGRRVTALSSLKDFDLVYLFREAALLGPAFFESWLRMSKVPYVFDFDDAVFLAYRSPANGYLSYLKFPGKTRGICRGAAHVMAGNRYLADYALDVNPNVTVIPTTIDTASYTLKPVKRSGSESVTLVWSGTFSTVQHLDTVRGALQRLAREEKFKLRVIGAPEYAIEGVEVEVVQWRSATEADDLRPGDIGMMPLPDDQWSKGKCGLKALQYMALGIPTICSPVGVNSTIIEHGRNGILAGCEDEWVHSLKRLINSPEERARLGAEGRRTVEKEFSATVQAPRVYEIFNSVARKK